MPGIPSEDACFFGGTPRNYALTPHQGIKLKQFYDMLGSNKKDTKISPDAFDTHI